MLSKAAAGARLVGLRRSLTAKLDCGRGLGTLAPLDEEFPGLPPLSPSASSGYTIESSSLQNGVKVVSIESGKTISVGLSIAAGSKYESASEFGSARLLQLSAFKATQRRTRIRMLRDLESVGSIPSSAANRERILYKVNALPEHAENGFLAAVESAFTPKLTPFYLTDLEHESEIDLELYSSDAKLQLAEALYEAAYGELEPYGHSFYHRMEHASLEAITEFRSRTFTGPSITIIGTGLAHAQLQSWAKNLTDTIPAKAGPPAPSAAYTGGDCRIKASVEQTLLGFALPSPIKGPEAAAAAVLAVAWSAKLPKGATAYHLPGLIGVTGSTTAAEAGTYAETLVQVMKGTGDFTPAKTKAQVQALQKLDEETFEALAEGSLPLSNVSESDVKGIHSKLWKSGLSMASLGNLGRVPKLSSLQ